MSVRRNILIIFEGSHLAYSPTIAQLYSAFSHYHDVTIMAQDPLEFSNNTTLPYKLELYKLNNVPGKYLYKALYPLVLLVSREARSFNRFFKNHYLDYFIRFLKVKKLLSSDQFDMVICVDLKNLYFVNAVLKKRSSLLSLELCYVEKALPYIDTSLIDAVIIQSEIRYNYLFKGKSIPTFIIPNSPTFRPEVIKESRSGLVYTGTAWKAFGFKFCLDFLLSYPNETMMVLGTVKGDIIKKNKEYNSLVENGRLLINESYIPDKEVVEFLSDYEVGFCFYDFSVEWINNFNYESAPSGKIFKYIAAGVPVICNNIVGFDFVDEFNCGIRIAKFDPVTIQEALGKIRSNYSGYVSGALRAAEHFNFDKAVMPLLEYTKLEKSYS